MKRLFCSLACVASLVAGGAPDDSRITIEKRGADKDSLTVSGVKATGPGGRLFLQTLMADLERSGWFKVDATGSTKVSGTVVDADKSVQAVCNVTWPGGSFQWSRGSGGLDARREAHLLSDEIVRRVKGVKGMAGTRIVMVRRHAGAAELFVCDSDGHNMIQVTHDNSFCVGPRWTPDGRSVYYTSYVNGRPCAYRISVETAAKQMLSGYLGLNAGAVVSPANGRDVAIVLSFPGNPELFLMHLGGGGLTRLTRTRMASEASPAWSPDGSRLAYVSDESGKAQLYLMDMATRQSRRLTLRGSENLSPNWSADGRIAYTTRRGGPYQIAVLDPNKGESPDVLTTGAIHEDPSWAPDNRHLVCSRREAGGASISIIDTLGDPEVRLFSLSGDWVSPDWSDR